MIFEGMDETLSFDNPLLKMAADYWAALTRDSRIPQRDDIDPLKLPREILPHVLLIDVEQLAVPRFQWRLIGTHITKVLGRDSTGRYIDDVLPKDMYDEFVEPLIWVVNQRRPIRIFGSADHVGKDWVPFENYLAPLVSDEDNINMLFGVALYGDPVWGASKKNLSPLGVRN